MSTRAIAPTVGVSYDTVHKDQRRQASDDLTPAPERIDPRTGEVVPPPARGAYAGDVENFSTRSHPPARPEPLLITDSPEAQQASSPRPRPHQRQPRTGSSIPGWAGLSRHGTPRATLGAGRTRSRAKGWTRPRAGYGRLRACFLARVRRAERGVGQAATVACKDEGNRTPSIPTRAREPGLAG